MLSFAQLKSQYVSLISCETITNLVENINFLRKQTYDSLKVTNFENVEVFNKFLKINNFNSKKYPSMILNHTRTFLFNGTSEINEIRAKLLEQFDIAKVDSTISLLNRIEETTISNKECRYKYKFISNKQLARNQKKFERIENKFFYLFHYKYLKFSFSNLIFIDSEHCLVQCSFTRGYFRNTNSLNLYKMEGKNLIFLKTLIGTAY